MDALVKAKSFLQRLETCEPPAQDTELQFLNCSKDQHFILATTSHDLVLSFPCHDEKHPKTWMLWPRGKTFLPGICMEQRGTQSLHPPDIPHPEQAEGSISRELLPALLWLLCRSSQLKLLPMDTVRAGLQITAPNSSWHVWGEAGTEHLVGSTGSITQSNGKSLGWAQVTAQQHNHGCATQRLHTNQNSDNSTEVGSLWSGKL